MRRVLEVISCDWCGVEMDRQDHQCLSQQYQGLNQSLAPQGNLGSPVKIAAPPGLCPACEAAQDAARAQRMKETAKQ